MTGLVLRRLLRLPIILFVIYTITFCLAWLIPGNPLENPEGRRPPAEIMAAMEAQYHLDDPWTFYWDYLGKGSGVRWLLGDRDGPVFDLGPSLKHENWTVNEILGAGLPVSFSLGFTAILIACAIGLTAGVIGGVRPGSPGDYVTLLIALIGISLPTFVIGTILP
ncbi:MAG: ABC transporter permease family protein [Planctomycetota bacterium]